MQSKLFDDEVEVDIEAHVEAARELLQSIQMRNAAEENASSGAGMPPQTAASQGSKTNENFHKSEAKNSLEKTDSKEVINPYSLPVDKNLGKSPAFKSVTRTELDKIKGTRPLYEENF